MKKHIISWWKSFSDNIGKAYADFVEKCVVAWWIILGKPDTIENISPKMKVFYSPVYPIEKKKLFSEQLPTSKEFSYNECDEASAHIQSILAQPQFSFNPKIKKKCIIIIHGFRNSKDSPWVQQMKDELLKEPSSANKTVVILLSWEEGCSSLPKYFAAASNTKIIGKWLAKFLQTIYSEEVYFWGIGPSLGAHALGSAGALFCRGTGFNRITALDPAGPGFVGIFQHKSRPRLNQDCAQFVDVIHTDGEKRWVKLEPKIVQKTLSLPITEVVARQYFTCGTLQSMGHADFYPNFGQVHSLLYFNPNIPSHTIAINYFIYSINHEKNFRKCLKLKHVPKVGEELNLECFELQDKTIEMGYHCKDKVKGCFYICTTGEKPFVP